METLRNDLRDHEARDREDFASRDERQREDHAAVIGKIDRINTELAEWAGGVKLLKVMAALGIPGILAAAGASILNLVRHWGATP